MRLLALFALVAVVIVGLLLAATLNPGALRSGNRFENWLHAVAGAEDDRGWSYLSPDSREQAYQGNSQAYVEEAQAADWSAFVWWEPRVIWTDDGFAHIEAALASRPSSVPRFLFDRRLIHGICVDRAPVGIGVYEDRRPFQVGGLGGGGLTGSGAACNRLFTDALP